MSEQVYTEKKSYKKELAIGLVNLVLAWISVFLFEYWFKAVGDLEPLRMALNLGVIVMSTITLFVAVTFYGRGTRNNLYRVVLTFGLAAATLTLIYFSGNTPEEMIYPFGGLSLVLIAFYMLSLSTDTLNLSGIVALSMVLATIILMSKKFEWIDWAMTGELSKYAVFIILFWGGVWPHFRSFMHGIKGTNRDGGGGDPHDRDGDTSDE